VKTIGKEDTRLNVLVMHRKWIPVPIDDSSIQEIPLILSSTLEYSTNSRGEVKACLFRSLASAFHHLGQRHTGSVLASMAKKFCNFPAEEQLDKAIQIVKNHERIYKKVDYWKKESGIAKHDLLGQPNDNQKLFVLFIMQSWWLVESFFTATLDSA
jgi:hypothetical protein